MATVTTITPMELLPSITVMVTTTDMDMVNIIMKSSTIKDIISNSRFLMNMISVLNYQRKEP
jgi:hypothetical protein